MNNSEADPIHPCPTEDDYKYLVYTVVYTIVFFGGLLFNGVAVYVFCMVRKKKGHSTICLLNLAVADLVFIVFLPLRITYYYKDGTWIFGDILCRLTTFSFYCSMYSSIFFMACLSIFRYKSVVHTETIKVKTARKVCAAIWVFTGLSTTPFLLSGISVRQNATRCFEPAVMSAWQRVMYMNYYALVVGFILPFLAIIVCNGLLIKHIVTIPMEKKTIRKQVTMIVLILLVCCVCFLPYHIQRTVHLHYLLYHPDICTLHGVLQKTVVTTLCLAVLNTCLDPLLYVFVGHGYKAWLQLLCMPKMAANVKSSSTATSGMQEAIVEEIPMNENGQMSSNEQNNVTLICFNRNPTEPQPVAQDPLLACDPIVCDSPQAL
ncbi:cysteinyl leukotriene receptor 2-like [Hyla sarda]|uniref:cysteinyl leukotriene receptor 2-like n=1 Tax=Hyla sarda TaxID=327740 RepID=UPI0024C253E6|nr:cysteinyl leukotriene receptor 2-like [Hyla sarda]XP_056419146.1 cysteinyl leukotriene receptor 2-like [Hyla sarda]XP_056419147.1 cysteinyl leukotriene receptor 2-like [Hyla sarda]